ncbi:hypothetical protein [Iningainema tapete]|uniref:DUF2281 domain-containing protein n=1 Tax=Iningainema tapete BLCC-T55 TaxID=2748662 RepID=A0A8J7CFJ5_9CYAN|nr:hypothetical protein [Iningainema tapete]MBD2775020.1 hypothetical protein [Iningainema tapete BLCC-T55]
MTKKELLLQEIESAPESLIAETLDFLQFLKTKFQKQSETHTASTDRQINLESDSPSKSNSTTPVESPQEIKFPTKEETPIIRGSTAGDLLKFAGTWLGDDFEECLQLVYDTRSKTKF